MNPTTRLEAVNLILRAVGKAPVNSLGSGVPRDVSIAEDVLDDSARAILSDGWHFNTESEITLSPSGGEITIPTTYLVVDVDLRDDPCRDLVQRGTKLYDKKNHTFTISKDVRVQAIIGFPFDECPQTIRHYITVSAAREFQERFKVDSGLRRYTREDEERAKAKAIRAETRSADYNVLNGGRAIRQRLRRSPLDDRFRF